MNQSKLESAVEAVMNTMSGFIISYCVWLFVVDPLLPWLSVHMIDGVKAFTITSIFTVTSLIRSYVWRRFFANDLHRAVHSTVIKILRG